MIKAMYIIAISLLIQVNVFCINIDFIRENYDRAVTDKNLCNQMIEDLKKAESTPLRLAYLGSLQTIWANHVFNPFGKLSTFNIGTKNIEKAVESDPNNAEIRYLRLSVQKNAPAFLGYSSMIETDEIFLKKNRQKINSAAVQKKLDQLI